MVLFCLSKCSVHLVCCAYCVVLGDVCTTSSHERAMALSRPVFKDTSDYGELQFRTAFAVKQMQQLHLQAEIDKLDEELQTAKRRKRRMAAIM